MGKSAHFAPIHFQFHFIITHLKISEIPTAIYYSKPLHLQEAFSDLGYEEGDFPISEAVSKKIFSLPFHPYLKSEDQDKIINGIHKALK